MTGEAASFSLLYYLSGMTCGRPFKHFYFQGTGVMLCQLFLVVVRLFSVAWWH